MNDKILIFGKGYVGTRLWETFRCDITTKRIQGYNDIVEELRRFKPRILINCIGHTGKHNVDDCEQKMDKTLWANTYFPLLLAEAAIRHGLKFIHISSGCIYHYDYKKNTPLTEEHLPDYYDLFYSRSKIYAENALRELSSRHNILIARIRVPLDNRPNPKNILTKLVKYQTVIDVPNSITYIPDFIKGLSHLIKKDARGIFNMVCEGGLRYPDLMKAYKKGVPDFQYKVIKLKDLKLVRTNLVLSVEKLKKSGFKVRKIDNILEECVHDYLNTHR